MAVKAMQPSWQTLSAINMSPTSAHAQQGYKERCKRKLEEMEELHQQDQEAAAAKMEEDGDAGAQPDAMQEDGQEEEARGQKRRKVDTVKHIPVGGKGCVFGHLCAVSLGCLFVTLESTAGMPAGCYLSQLCIMPCNLDALSVWLLQVSGRVWKLQAKRSGAVMKPQLKVCSCWVGACVGLAPEQGGVNAPYVLQLLFAPLFLYA
jgi:hypothetical protein